MANTPDMAAGFEDGKAAVDYWRQAWFDGTSYWYQNSELEWLNANETAMKRYLQGFGLAASLTKRDLAAGHTLSQVARELRHIHMNRRVDYVGGVAGYKRGMHRMNGRRVLVVRELETPEPEPLTDEWDTAEVRNLAENPYWYDPESLDALNELIEERGGDYTGWPVIGQLLENLLCATLETGVVVEQRPWLFGMLADRLQIILQGVDAHVGAGPCQALFIAGEVNCGKTRLSELIMYLLGNRRAKPYPYLVGQTNFNSELFEAALLLVDDEADKTDIKSRHYLAQQLKNMLVAGAQRVEGKGKDALELTPAQLIMMLCNDDQDSLRVLPPLDLVGDKVILMKAYRKPMPMPTRTRKQQAAFWATVKHEAPRFMHWLLNDFVLPKHAQPETRFPVGEWHHPEVVELMDEMSPWLEFWHLLERTLLHSDRKNFHPRDEDEPLPAGCWAGASNDLVAEFTKNWEEWGLSRTEKDRMNTSWVGRHLKTAMQRWPDRVIQGQRSAKSRYWWLSASGWENPKEVGR